MNSIGTSRQVACSTSKSMGFVWFYHVFSIPICNSDSRPWTLCLKKNWNPNRSYMSTAWKLSNPSPAPWHSDDWPGLLCWLFWHASTERCWTSAETGWLSGKFGPKVVIHWILLTHPHCPFTCFGTSTTSKQKNWKSEQIWESFGHRGASYKNQSPKPHPAVDTHPWVHLPPCCQVSSPLQKFAHAEAPHGTEANSLPRPFAHSRRSGYKETSFH